MLLNELVQILESIAPPIYQESYDNSGLIVGNPEMEITNALICLDSTEAVIEEAIERGCNVVIAHHPIVFGGLKKITGKNYVERTVIRAIQNKIAIYAIHTNLDNVKYGVNSRIANLLDLKNLSILRPKTNDLKKLAVYCPESYAATLRYELGEAGAGNIGNYDHCSFATTGIGTFRGNNDTKPFVGQKGEIHSEVETKIEVIFPAHLQYLLLSTLRKHHPYEEIAYDIYPIENPNTNIGSGMIGELEQPEPTLDFFKKIKAKFNVAMIRHTSLMNKSISRVAVCGGSGSFLLNDAIAAKADLYITADFKYHEFFDAENKLIIADIGHYESEQFTKELLLDLLIKKKPTFAPLLSNIDTNPVKYF
jgi:dinuclear metal center YbgI/SA1388 family protein